MLNCISEWLLFFSVCLVVILKLSLKKQLSHKHCQNQNPRHDPSRGMNRSCLGWTTIPCLRRDNCRVKVMATQLVRWCADRAMFLQIFIFVVSLPYEALEGVQCSPRSFIRGFFCTTVDLWPKYLKRKFWNFSNIKVPDVRKISTTAGVFLLNRDFLKRHLVLKVCPATFKIASWSLALWHV